MLNRRFRRSSQRAKPKSFKNSFLIAVFETCFILCSTPSRFVKTKPPFWSEKAEDVESCTRTVHLFVGRNRLFHAILHFRRSFLVSRKELSYSVISLTNSDNEDDYKSCFLFCNGFFADVISRLSFLLSFLCSFLLFCQSRAWHGNLKEIFGSSPNMTKKKGRTDTKKSRPADGLFRLFAFTPLLRRLLWRQKQFRRLQYRLWYHRHSCC